MSHLPTPPPTRRNGASLKPPDAASRRARQSALTHLPPKGNKETDPFLSTNLPLPVAYFLPPGPFIVDYLDYKDPLPSRLSRSFKESVGLSRGKEINGRTMVPRVSEKFVGGDKLPYNDGNKIRTQRFGSYMVQWLPHSVYFQFRRSANIYFAIICVLQMMPFSPKMPEPTVLGGQHRCCINM